MLTFQLSFRKNLVRIKEKFRLETTAFFAVYLVWLVEPLVTCLPRYTLYRLSAIELSTCRRLKAQFCKILHQFYTADDQNFIDSIELIMFHKLL